MTPANGFTDFESPAPAVEPESPPGARTPAPVRRDDFYDTPIVDGKPAPNTPVPAFAIGCARCS